MSLKLTNNQKAQHPAQSLWTCWHLKLTSSLCRLCCRYAMTNWIASRMDDIEFEDAYLPDDQLTMFPSWIRAFHDLEQNWEEFSAQRAEVEQSAEKFQNLYEQRVQVGIQGIRVLLSEALPETSACPTHGPHSIMGQEDLLATGHSKESSEVLVPLPACMPGRPHVRVANHQCYCDFCFEMHRNFQYMNFSKHNRLVHCNVQAEEMGMLDPLDTQEVESLEEKEEDPLEGLLEGILPNTGPLADSDDFAQELMPDEIAAEPVCLVPGVSKPPTRLIGCAPYYDFVLHVHPPSLIVRVLDTI